MQIFKKIARGRGYKERVFIEFKQSLNGMVSKN